VAALLFGALVAFEPALRARLVPAPSFDLGDGPAVTGRAETVSVNINATPWARVTVDGEELGVTPLGSIAMQPGLHHIVARMADGREIEQEIWVDAENRHIVLGGEASDAGSPDAEAPSGEAPDASAPEAGGEAGRERSPARLRAS